MPSDEIKVGQEVYYKARTYWHPAIVREIYEQPRALKVQCRSTLATMILRPSDVRTELEEGFEFKSPTKRRVKKTTQEDLFPHE